jgi:hypothetical protein
VTFHVCSCCGRALTLSDWLSLKYLGVMQGDATIKSIELRNCTCNSTIARTVEEVYRARSLV